MLRMLTYHLGLLSNPVNPMVICCVQRCKITKMFLSGNTFRIVF
jgi:hypothetical protein